jgi:hypothetical protein
MVFQPDICDSTNNCGSSSTSYGNTAQLQASYPGVNIPVMDGKAAGLSRIVRVGKSCEVRDRQARANGHSGTRSFTPIRDCRENSLHPRARHRVYLYLQAVFSVILMQSIGQATDYKFYNRSPGIPHYSQLLEGNDQTQSKHGKFAPDDVFLDHDTTSARYMEEAEVEQAHQNRRSVSKEA